MKNSDENFIKGFLRYTVIEDSIIASDSWDSFLKALKEKNTGLTQRLWQEYQFTNYIIFIEHELAEFYYVLAEKDLLKNKQTVRKMLVDKVKNFKRLSSEEDAEELLLQEVKSDEKHFYTPFVFFTLAGFYLGDFTYFIIVFRLR